MTPFGQKMRELRRAKGVTQRQMAEALGVSPSYLSALEHGHRGVPNWALIQKIVGYFHIIWDEAEALQRLAEASHPRVVVDTAGLHPEATRLANLLERHIGELSTDAIAELIRHIEDAAKQVPGKRSSLSR